MAFFRRRRPTIDLDARSPQLGLKYKDLLVLEQLVKAGADLTQPRHILYYVYVPDRERAESAVAEATANGFEALVRDPLPDYPHQWTVVAELHNTVLGMEMVRDNTDYFEQLAATHGGDYDGWEASVT